MRKIAVYILECSDGTYYTGVSNDPERREREHNEGLDPDAYTYSRRPVKIVWGEFYSSPLLAIATEKKIKKWSRAKKKAIIENRWEDLKQLSKKKFPKAE
ncbi:MAG TPA: GIY-YIG nuclease family protein [Bacteroidia bacterium]|nr:GIY-YIG nuclease family protein [Bacteroidia bacterium]